MDRRRLIAGAIALMVLFMLFIFSLPRPSASTSAPVAGVAPPAPKRATAIDAAPKSSIAPPGEPEPHEPSAPRPFRGDSMVLDNGLTLILVEDHTVPTIATRIVVRVGAAHEPSEHGGLAHLVEHLMFMGTTELGTTSWADEGPWQEDLALLTERLAQSPRDVALQEEVAATLTEADAFLLRGDYDRTLDRIGATGVNAFTMPETTEYVADLPTNSLLPWAVLEAERFSDPVFRSFPRVHEIVQLEMDQRRSTGAFTATAQALEVLFRGHPYAQPIGGEPQTIDRLHLGAARDFHRSYYHPANVAIILVGSFNTADARGILEEAFGGWNATGPTPTVPEFTGRSGIVGLPRERDLHRVVWALGKLTPEEEPAVLVGLSVLAAKVGAGTNGWGVPTLGYEWLDEGALVQVRGFCRPSTTRTETCVETLRRALRETREDGVSRADLDWLRRRLWINTVRSMEDPNTQAAAIADAWSRGLDLDTQWALVDRLRMVSVEQANEAIDVYLTPDDYGITGDTASERTKSHSFRLPDGPRNRGRSALRDLVTKIEREPLEAIWPEEGRDYAVSDDGRVVVAFNPANTLFEMSLVYPRGWADDPLLPHALQAWEHGAARSDSVLGTLRSYGVAVRVVDAGPEHTEIVVDGPREGVDAALQLLPASLVSPVLDRRYAYPRPTGTELGWLLHGPSTPWVKPPRARSPAQEAIERSIQALSGLAPRVRASGLEDPNALARSTDGTTPHRVVHPVLEHEDLRVGVLETDAYSNSPVELVVRLPYRPPEDEALYALLERMYTGRTGLARERIREERALSYTYSAKLHRPADTPGWLQVRTRVRHDRVEEAGEVLLDLFRNPDLDEEEWTQLVRKTEKRAFEKHTHFRQLAAAVQGGQDLGLPGAPAESVWLGLQDVHRDDFEALLDEFAESPTVLTIRSPHIDQGHWGRFGTVQVMP